MANTLADDVPTPTQGLGDATADFFLRLPALVVALSWLRLAELLAGNQAGGTIAQFSRLALGALLVDLVNLARYLPALFLLSLPLLLIRSRRLRYFGLALVWSVLLLVQAGLVQYFLIARVPLGADWFGYSTGDLQSTVRGGLEFSPWLLVGLATALVALWLMLATRSRQRSRPSGAGVAIIAASLVVLALAPARSEFLSTRDEDTRSLMLSKLGFFVDDNVGYFLRSRLPVRPAPANPPAAAASASASAGGSMTGMRYLDPAYPFLHAEQTVDTLGPHFRTLPGQPPNLVLVIVEGLGRSFSGPDAALGSFTPELDKLVGHSLYWENFLAVQGRTFAVMPSLLASAPFADNGMSGLGEKMPPHHSLLSVLKSQGYWLKFYCGYDADFDNESMFLLRQGVDVLVDRYSFGDGYPTSNSWGYADGDLVSRALAAERVATRQPFATLMKTVTMHSPYVFRGQADFAGRFEQRLEQLGIAESRKKRYRAHQNIYTSILHADQALGRFFEQTKRNPGYENTVFVLVGDHRLPEIPMATRIERYHVPLMIFSPLLKAPARIKSVSSHFDLTPALLAFLSKNHGLQTPREVTWLGTGLDTEPAFRNLHRFPMKQTKTNLVDFVSGTSFINHEQLYVLGDGMDIEPSYDAAKRQRVQAEFQAFRAANERFAREPALLPPAAKMKEPQFPVSGTGKVAVLSVADLRASGKSRNAPLDVEVVFVNGGPVTSKSFVPIIVLTKRNGETVSETYGEPRRLLPRQRLSLRFALNSADLGSGQTFVSVIAVRPGSRQRIGTGRHHVPVQVGD